MMIYVCFVADSVRWATKCFFPVGKLVFNAQSTSAVISGQCFFPD